MIDDEITATVTIRREDLARVERANVAWSEAEEALGRDYCHEEDRYYDKEDREEQREAERRAGDRARFAYARIGRLVIEQLEE